MKSHRNLIHNLIYLMFNYIESYESKIEFNLTTLIGIFII